MTSQSEMQAQIRKILESSTTGTFNENFLLLAKEEGYTGTESNGAMLNFLRGRLNTSSGDINDLQAQFAAQFGFSQWNGLNQVIPDDYALWIDSDDSSRITFGASTAVRAYSDKSGNGVSVGQSTSSLQPNYNATGLNSKGVFEFSSDNLVTGTNFNLTNGITAFVLVSSITNTGAEDYIIGQWDATGNNRQFHIGKSNTDVFQAVFSPDGSSSVIIAGDLTSSGQVLTFTHNGINAGAVYQNGVFKNFNVGDIKPTGTSALTIGALNSAGGGTFAGGVAAVIIYTRLLSDGERTQVERYLMKKYGLS